MTRPSPSAELLIIVVAQTCRDSVPAPGCANEDTARPRLVCTMSLAYVSVNGRETFRQKACPIAYKSVTRGLAQTRLGLSDLRSQHDADAWNRVKQLRGSRVLLEFAS